MCPIDTEAVSRHREKEREVRGPCHNFGSRCLKGYSIGAYFDMTHLHSEKNCQMTRDNTTTTYEATRHET